MRRCWIASAVALALLVPLAAPAVAQEMFVVLSATLSGDNEVSGGSGSGAAIVEIDVFTGVIPPGDSDAPPRQGGSDGGQKLGTVCYQLTLESVDNPVAAHIHQGAPGVDGDVLVDFDIAANGLEGCVTLEAEPLEAIVADPTAYYVNVHTDEFPDGAVRGQLEGDAASSGEDETDAGNEELATTGSSLTLLLVMFGLILVGAGTLLHRPPRHQPR